MSLHFEEDLTKVIKQLREELQRDLVDRSWKGILCPAMTTRMARAWK